MPQSTVIVVGSGLAGLTASSTLTSHSIPVVLLERSPKSGGNSMKASSGINGAPTKYQPGPPLSDTFFQSDTIRSAGSVYEDSLKKEREKLISTLTNSSAEAIKWLVEEKGVDLSVVSQLGGHSFARTHRGAGKIPPGASIVTTLLKSLKESPVFTLETSCTVTKVLTSSTDKNVVTGVEYVQEKDGDKETKQLFGPVIFTTGGFAGDAHGMLAKYRPDLAGFPSTNDPRPGSQDLLTAIGAQVLDMEQVQIHPTSFISPLDPLNLVKFLAAEILRGEGGILLFEGKRFVNEMGTRKVVTDAITSLPVAVPESGVLQAETEANPSPKQYNITLLLTPSIYARIKSHVDFYIFKSLMRLVPLPSLPFPETTIKTLKSYSAVVEGRVPDGFGRSSFGSWGLREENVEGELEVYVGTVTPATHFTMGGVLISEKGEVMAGRSGGEETMKEGQDREGEGREKIQGLWAAGEVTGGVHGENRLGGSSLLECVVFGRIVGEEVRKYLSEGSVGK